MAFVQRVFNSLCHHRVFLGWVVVCACAFLVHDTRATLAAESGDGVPQEALPENHADLEPGARQETPGEHSGESGPDEEEGAPDFLSDESTPQEGSVARLHVLDKTTARSQTIEVPVGKVVQHGPLRISVCQCYRNDPESSPEARAWLDIWYVEDGEAAEHVFSGWMFSSSPSVSALEHPGYDVWLKDCP